MEGECKQGEGERGKLHGQASPGDKGGGRIGEKRVPELGRQRRFPIRAPAGIGISLEFDNGITGRGTTTKRREHEAETKLAPLAAQTTHPSWAVVAAAAGANAQVICNAGRALMNRRDDPRSTALSPPPPPSFSGRERDGCTVQQRWRRSRTHSIAPRDDAVY